MRRLAALVAMVALAGACSSDDEPERGLDPLEAPQFAPDTGAATSTAPVAVEGGPATTAPTSAPAGETSAETTTTTTTTTAPTAPTEPERAERQVVSFEDPVGDAVGGLDQDPPPWSDLAGGTLERQGDAYRLAVRLGGEAPEEAPGSETMNIATFYDVDGDGAVDHEIWVNLDGEGWGPVWYDDQGNVAPGDESMVDIEVEGDSVHLIFPASILGAPERFRFSIASEYGDVEVIGTDFARRDDAPDDDQAVSFP